MKLIKILALTCVAFSLIAVPAFAAPKEVKKGGCCDKAGGADKCTHGCCKKAAEKKEICEKCNGTKK